MAITVGRSQTVPTPIIPSSRGCSRVRLAELTLNAVKGSRAGPATIMSAGHVRTGQTGHADAVWVMPSGL